MNTAYKTAQLFLSENNYNGVVRIMAENNLDYVNSLFADGDYVECRLDGLYYVYTCDGEELYEVIA